MKTCSKCGNEKPLDEFYVDSRGYRRPDCIPCNRAASLARTRANPGGRWAYRMMYEYGLTEAEWERLYTTQGGRCAICGTSEPGHSRHRRLHVDHDHQTGRVRGLLCNGCNRALGFMQDDPDRLTRAAAYVTMFTAPPPIRKR